MRLGDVLTPTLILERAKLEANLAAMTRRMKALGVRLRPHLKTAKSAKIAELAVAGNFGGLTVSTLAEARYFAEAGFRDLTYAVGLVPDKLPDLALLLRDGVSLSALVDDERNAQSLGSRAAALGVTLELLVEIDTGLGRAGLAPDAPELIPVAQTVHAHPHLRLKGVLTHAGHSYHCRGAEAVRRVAGEERQGLVIAAERLRAAGLPCPVVSAGSTPTAVFAERLDGVSEMRPGNYMFFDLDQVGIGTCRVEDVALSVLATVIGHNRRSGTILIDAGALALSKDIGAREFLPDAGYGWVLDRLGRERIVGLSVSDVHQEHGLVTARQGPPPFDRLPIGSRVRVLPNHSCLTSALYDRYHVVEGGEDVLNCWQRIDGW